MESGFESLGCREGNRTEPFSPQKENIENTTYWFINSDTPVDIPIGGTFLLPYYEYTVAYKDRNMLADPEQKKLIGTVNPSSILAPVIVVDGRVVGTWKHKIEKKNVIVETNLIALGNKKAVSEADGRYGKFWELPLALTA
jgi:hypothetical protein